MAYRLGRNRATGVLTLRPAHGDPELLVLRRGFLMSAHTDPSGRRASQRLARLASHEQLESHFDGGTTAYPPGAIERQFPLSKWARSHLEAQVDAGLAQRMLDELAGIRLALRPELVPLPALCDATDVRIIAAMDIPRRLDQIWPIARTPRFRLLTFVHFLRSVGAVRMHGVAAPSPQPRPTVATAHAILGVSNSADRITVKRAYRRLARALHPDLQPLANDERRRGLERKLADVTRAYRELSPSRLA